MKTLEYTVLVNDNHEAVIHLPAEIPPGRHTLRIVIQDRDADPDEECPETFPTLGATQWPEDLSLRREEMYDDDGR